VIWSHVSWSIHWTFPWSWLTESIWVIEENDPSNTNMSCLSEPFTVRSDARIQSDRGPRLDNQRSMSMIIESNLTSRFRNGEDPIYKFQETRSRISQHITSSSHIESLPISSRKMLSAHCTHTWEYLPNGSGRKTVFTTLLRPTWHESEAGLAHQTKMRLHGWTWYAQQKQTINPGSKEPLLDGWRNM